MGRSSAYKQLLWQVIISLFFAVIALFAHNLRDAYSVLLGGVAVIIPTYLFILCAFRFDGARAVGKIMGSLYLGELLKLVSMAVLIAVVLKYIPVRASLFILSFLGVQLLSTLAGFWQANKMVART